MFTFEEPARTLIFSSKSSALAFKKKALSHLTRGGGAVSIRKTKGWRTYSLVFKPYAYSDTMAIMALYSPESPHYRDIINDLRNP
jgi:hypothetical protein